MYTLGQKAVGMHPALVCVLLQGMRDGRPLHPLGGLRLLVFPAVFGELQVVECEPSLPPSSPPILPPLVITGGCSKQAAALDNVAYDRAGHTASGAPYYRSPDSSYYIYWDPSCDGGADRANRNPETLVRYLRGSIKTSVGRAVEGLLW